MNNWKDIIKNEQITWIKEGSEAASLGKEYAILNKLMILNHEALKQIRSITGTDVEGFTSSIERGKGSSAGNLIKEHIKELQNALENWFNHPGE